MVIRTLTPWRGRSRLVNPLGSDLEDLFDRFTRSFDLAPAWNGEEFQAGLTPRVDVQESEKEYVVNAELPGIAESDIEVSLSDDVLTISGEKKQEKEDKEKNYHRVERVYGQFQRQIALPSGQADETKTAASFKNGVLTVKIPKREEKQNVKKIPVRAE